MHLRSVLILVNRNTFSLKGKDKEEAKRLVLHCYPLSQADTLSGAHSGIERRIMKKLLTMFLLAIPACASPRVYGPGHLLELRQMLAEAERASDNEEAMWLRGTIRDIETKEAERRAENERRETVRLAEEKRRAEEREEDARKFQEEEERFRQWLASLTPEQQLQWRIHEEQMEVERARLAQIDRLSQQEIKAGKEIQTAQWEHERRQLFRQALLREKRPIEVKSSGEIMLENQKRVDVYVHPGP